MEQVEFLKGQIAWANKLLDAPAVTFPNGRNSHEAAAEVLEQSEDALIDHERYAVTPSGLVFSHHE